MKNKYFLLVLLFSIFYNSSNASEDLTKFVNPFIGTGGHGHTYPGATLPFGMVQLSPDTRLDGWDGCSAYYNDDTLLYGFSHTHLSGTGCPDYGDILLLPVSLSANPKFEFNNQKYASPFKKSSEKATPNYYSVFLDKYGVKAELTATIRCGVHRYSFPDGKTAGVLLDLKHRDEVIDSKIQILNDSTVVGYRISRAWADKQHVYFAIHFSEKIKKNVIALNDTIINLTNNEISGKNLKAYFVFSNDKEIISKVGISGTSIEGALANLAAEADKLTFDQALENGKVEWNKELGRVSIQSNDIDKKTTFYTALYHTFVVPNIYNDVNGDYLGRDFKIHKIDKGDYYTVFSLWDTYRAANPLYTILQQNRTSDIINTFIKEYEQGGLLPVWEFASNETYCMIGYHAVPIITDAYMKGFRDFDIETAFKAMKHSADTNLFGLALYQKDNFLMSDLEHESVSKTLEYAYDDWCISQVAASLGRTDDYKRFTIRAQSYKNLFDKKTEFIRARYNGGWFEPFDPTEVNNNYTEANCWQYNFYVPQDISTYMKMYGGKENFAKKLDELFTTKDKVSGREQADISGLIGQYAHGNEPSHQIVYMYNYCGKPWKTQELISKICNEFYTNAPDGLIGNEDCGQMSAWLVLSSFGFYQVCPGALEYSIGTPQFEDIKLNLESGKVFHISAKNFSKKNIYIQSAKLNGKDYSKCYIKYQDIMSGGDLEFTMGASPNKSWGSSDNDVPQTEIKDYPIAIAPAIISARKTFRNSQNIEIECESKAATIRYTLDGSEPNESSLIYKSPIHIDTNLTINACTYQAKSHSAVVTAKFYKIPNNRTIKILSKYQKQYSAGGDEGLIDGIRGEINFRHGGWQGYQGQDFEAIVDLGEVLPVKRIAAGFLQDVRPWIFFPKSIEFYVSSDGVEFKLVEKIKNNYPDTDFTPIIKDFETKYSGSCRYVKVKAEKYGKLPDWHPGAGDESHLFIDEIIIE